MFALLLLYTFAAASSVLGQHCASLTTPDLCNGKPSSQGAEYVCAWNVRTVTPSCISVEAEEFNLCALYNGNAVACAAQPTCFYDQEDMECEVLEPREGHGEAPEREAPEREDIIYHPPIVQPQPAQPSPPAQPSQPVQPAQPAQPSQPVQPSQPAQPAQPQVTPSPPQTGTPAPPVVAPNTPATPQPQPASKVPATQPPVTNPPPQPQPQPQPQPVPQGPKHCERLPQTQCFGPSVVPGQLCMWDAEDFECSSVAEGDAEAICKQFAGDMQKCDAQLDCFWDAKDRECSEVKQGAGSAGIHVPVSTSCAALTTETACAGTAACFWDDPLCVNVVQAVNVCQVYTTPKLCSTNALCHWKTSCMFASATTAGFHLRQASPGLFAPSQMAPATGYQPVPGTQPQAGFAPAGQAQPAQPGAYGAAAQPGVAAQPGMVGQQPGMQPQAGAAQQPGMVAPQQPGAYPGAAPAAPQQPPAQPGVPPQQPGAYPGTATQPVAPPPVQPGMGPSSGYGRAQFCKMLSKQECFGPSLQPGEYCMWDAEDFECSSYNEHDAEGICKQYGLDPAQCDAQMDCFWDVKDRECTDVKGIIPGRGRGGASIRTTCINYKTAETCAAQASCYWEQTGAQKVCVNVVQAANVCRVLTSPVTCSTNILCTWQGSTCDLASGHWLTQVNSKTTDPKAAHARKHTKTHQKSSSTKWSFIPSLIMIILGFAVGVLATLGCRKKKTTDFQTPLDMDYVQQKGDTFA